MCKEISGTYPVLFLPGEGAVTAWLCGWNTAWLMTSASAWAWLNPSVMRYLTASFTSCKCFICASQKADKMFLYTPAFPPGCVCVDSSPETGSVFLTCSMGKLRRRTGKLVLQLNLQTLCWWHQNGLFSHSALIEWNSVCRISFLWSKETLTPDVVMILSQRENFHYVSNSIKVLISSQICPGIQQCALRRKAVDYDHRNL